MVLRHLAKDSAIYGGADLISKIIAFFTFPLIAAALSPKAFGALELIMTSTAILGLFVSCGLNNSVQRFYWDEHTSVGDRPIVVSSGFVAQLAFGLIAILIGLFLIPFIAPLVKEAELPFTKIALVSGLLLMAFSQWQQYLLDVIRLHSSPWKFMAISLLIRASGLILGVVAVLYFSWGIDGLLSVQAVVGLLILPLAIWVVKKDITLNINKKWLQELIRFGHPFVLAGMAYWIFGSIDRWMLAGMTSVEEVGIYSVAYRFASIVLFVSMAFGQAWSPLAIKIKSENPQTYRSIYANVLLILFFLMLIIGGNLALFSGELISLVLPVEYHLSALPLAVLCIGIVLQSTQQVTAIGISLEKKTFIFARLAWITAVINAGLNWLLIPSYGAFGAAWATTISYLVLTMSYLYYTQKLHPLPIDWYRLVIILFLGFIIATVALSMSQSTILLNIVITKFATALSCFIAGWLVLQKKGDND